jgi:Heterokaryon incompatibility protein (HET)
VGLKSSSIPDIKETPSQKGVLYQPLNLERDEIRLLHISPARKSDGIDCGIECSLTHASLGDLPEYDALSYAWGGQSDLRQIILDGYSFDITCNLYNALSRLRSFSMSKTIWIDAICINQADAAERSSQVSKMGRIFKSARKVIAWVGESDRESNLAFVLLHDLMECIQDRARSTALIKDRKYFDNWYGLYLLFYRDYWWRVWVIQEVTLAKTITLLCGTDSISWSNLVAIQENLASFHIKDIDEIAHEREDLSFLRITIKSRGPRALSLSPHHEDSLEVPSLTQVLLKHRFKEATDPKDMIYSLVGLSTAHQDPRFILDYSRSVCQVYTDAVEYEVSTPKDLTIICAMPRWDSPHKLPSWVPDWSFGALGSSLLEDSSKHQFAAAGSSDAEAKFPEDKKILYAKGIVLNNTSIVGEVPKMHDLDEYNASATFIRWHKLLESETEDSISLEGAFCETILRERYQEDDVLKWRSKPDFFRWLLGAYTRAIQVVCPDIKLDAKLVNIASYKASWRSPLDDEILGSVLVKLTAEMLFGRRVFVSNSKLGQTGIGPESIVEGDVICVLLGCQLPVILRPEKSHYIYLGEAYVDGYMYGKAMDELAQGKREIREFEIH